MNELFSNIIDQVLNHCEVCVTDIQVGELIVEYNGISYVIVAEDLKRTSELSFELDTIYIDHAYYTDTELWLAETEINELNIKLFKDGKTSI